MPQIKFTEEAQSERLKRLAHLRELRKDIAELADLKNTPEWAKLVRSLRKWSSMAKNEEAWANSDHDSEEIDAQTFSRRVIRARQKQADFDFIAELLDKHGEKVKDLDTEIKRVEDLFKEAKKALA